MARDLYSLNLLSKLMVLLQQILLDQAIAAITETVLMQISTEQVPSLHRIASRYLTLVTTELLAVHADMCTDVVRAVGHDLALFCANFHSICLCSVYESVCEVLKYIIAVNHKISVVGQS